jgi:hypothetical protein
VLSAELHDGRLGALQAAGQADHIGDLGGRRARHLGLVVLCWRLTARADVMAQINGLDGKALRVGRLPQG